MTTKLQTMTLYTYIGKNIIADFLILYFFYTEKQEKSKRKRNKSFFLLCDMMVSYVLCDVCECYIFIL